MSAVRQGLQNNNVTDRATNIILSGWREGTSKQYTSYFIKWNKYCEQKGRGSTVPDLHSVLDFLAELFEQGIGYSAINTARSALSSMMSTMGQPAIGNHPLVCRFMRGVFNRKPSLPRYTSTWDASIVLKYLSDASKESLKDMTLQLATLLALLSGRRVHFLNSMTVDERCIKFCGDKCIITVDALTKTTRPGHHVAPLSFLCYKTNPKLCIVCRLRHYLTTTESLRGSTNLFVSYIKPHKAVSGDTLGRWIKQTLAGAGVDITTFKAHSTRSAASSAASRGGAPTDLILRSIGWTNAKTYAKFYDKPVYSSNTLHDFILNAPSSSGVTQSGVPATD